MNCKNCNHLLSANFNYCPHCGAKVIRHRITFKNLGTDFFDRYFNLDNTFLRTFIDLFKQPEKVIDSYISGTRKRYLNPISYLGIALTLSGLLLFLLKKVYFDYIDFNVLGTASNPETARKIMNTTLDFSSFIFVLLVPMVAVAGWLLFNTKKYVFVEYLVAITYALGHYSIFSFLFFCVSLIVAPKLYMTMSLVGNLLMMAYMIYVCNKIAHFNTFDRVWRSLVFLVLYIFLFFMLSIALNLLLLLTGVLQPSDLLPPPK